MIPYYFQVVFSPQNVRLVLKKCSVSALLSAAVCVWGVGRVRATAPVSAAPAPPTVTMSKGIDLTGKVNDHACMPVLPSPPATPSP